MKKLFVLLLIAVFICCAHKKSSFDFWEFTSTNDLKKSLIELTPAGSGYDAIENFLGDNVGFFDNSKILMDNKNNSCSITLILVKENLFKFLLKNPKYHSSLVIIYKFDSEKKLLNIDINGIYP